jgi:rhodanese-related sulfurtransferase
MDGPSKGGGPMTLPRFSTNARLGLLAGALGLLAVAGGDPGQGHHISIDTKELAVIVQKEVDHLVPDSLAGWIIAGKTDYRLIDLRTPAEYALYHIPTAENVQLAALPDYGLTRNEKIVLYSEGGIHSAQAWMLLKAKGYKGPTILFGGLEGWKEDVLFPSLGEGAVPGAKTAFEKKREISRFFGGSARTATTEQQKQLVMPDVVPPAAPPVLPAGSGKKRKEGC